MVLSDLIYAGMDCLAILCRNPEERERVFNILRQRKRVWWGADELTPDSSTDECWLPNESILYIEGASQGGSASLTVSYSEVENGGIPKSVDVGFRLIEASELKEYAQEQSISKEEIERLLQK